MPNEPDAPADAPDFDPFGVAVRCARLGLPTRDARPVLARLPGCAGKSRDALYKLIQRARRRWAAIRRLRHCPYCYRPCTDPATQEGA